MTIQVLAPRDVHTTLNYYSPLDAQPPCNYVEDPPADVPRTNVGLSAHSAIIHDAREKGDTLSLDTNGFQFVHYRSIEKDFVDEDKIKSAYYAEIEDILRKHTGAKRILVFDHTIRRGPTGSAKAPHRTPVQRVHVDQTPVSAAQRVEYHLGDEAEGLLKGRYRIINVWRPIANTVAHHPLAVADYRTVDVDRDLVSTRHIYPHREGATFNVKHNRGHEWYYLSDQTSDEVTLIKCFDST